LEAPVAEAVHVGGTSDPAAPAAARVTRWTPAAIVIAMAVALVAVIWAIFLFLCWQGFGTTLENAKIKVQGAADVMAAETTWMLGSAHAVLAQLAASAPLPADITADQKSVLDAALRPFPASTSLGIYDAAGTAWANAASPSLPASIADEDFFKVLEDGGDWTVSPQRADAATGRPVFVVAQRLGGAEFGGIVTLTISGEVLDGFWRPQKLGEDSTVCLIRLDGWLVGRYPPLKQTIELKNAPVFAPGSADIGTYVSESSPADGVARVVGFHKLPQLGVVAIASIGQHAVFAPLWSAILIVTALIGPISIMLLIFAFVIARMLRQSARTQASLAAALEHNEVLFREIHHRVKNNLQSVGSLLQMQPIAKEIKANMGQRIAAMSAVHEHIYRTGNFSTVRAKDYLTTLIENIRAGGDPKVRVVAHLDDVAVDKDAATPLGLIVNEVVSNAFKHAFPGGREGEITVTMTPHGTHQARLTVEDNGAGFDPTLPVKGIGQRLIKALTMQIGGQSEMTTGPNGSRFTLVFPTAG
jgi:two-component sensor histidine kinase